jgi:hypothetical protein
LIDEKRLADYFTNFKATAFRLETLPVYRVPAEEEYFSRFLSGGDFPEDWKDNPWVRGIVQSGRSMQRVHVVTPPLSDYLKFQLSWGYPGNVVDGEDVRILDTSQVELPDLPDHDYWLFDESTVLRMNYADDGTFLGAEHLTDGSVAEYLAYRDRAVGVSVPYAEYWSGQRQSGPGRPK